MASPATPCCLCSMLCIRRALANAATLPVVAGQSVLKAYSAYILPGRGVPCAWGQPDMCFGADAPSCHRHILGHIWPSGYLCSQTWLEAPAALCLAAPAFTAVCMPAACLLRARRHRAKADKRLQVTAATGLEGLTQQRSTPAAALLRCPPWAAARCSACWAASCPGCPAAGMKARCLRCAGMGPWRAA